MRGRWRFALPNLITCLSMTAGLLGVSEAIAARFESSAWFILLCVLLDKADGTVARWLRATSRFGIEMDSLSDLISFGVAPAVLALAFLSGKAAATPLAALAQYRALVYAGSFLYVIAAALRLAKFNVVTETYGSKFFFGIPTTVCGALVASYFLTARKYALPIRTLEALPVVMIVLALLMVSRIPFPKVGRRETLVMNAFTLVNVFFVYLCGLLRIFPEFLLGCAVIYPVVGAIWALGRGIKPPPLAPPSEEKPPAA